MTIPSIKLLRDALFNPISTAQMKGNEWDLLIRQARQAGLLARIYAVIQDYGITGQIPARPFMHLESAAIVATRQRRELAWEVDQIEAALRPIGIPVVLLKGAAYTMANLDAATGRLFSDVDILIPRAALSAVESELMKHGWISTTNSAYDQQYYRTWMHEIPPMRHFRRGTVIDVHHAILPISARFHPDSEKLLANAVPLDKTGRIKALAPEDMLLHSATHLFHEGELERGLRDLVDLDSLLRQFGRSEGFWERLVPRAIELDLSRPLFYALRYTRLILGTDIPESVMLATEKTPGCRHDGILLHFMDALFLRALRPAHTTCADSFTPLARWLLYIRSHWIRMPPWLLVLHLIRKGMFRLKPLQKSESTA